MNNVLERKSPKRDKQARLHICQRAASCLCLDQKKYFKNSISSSLKIIPD
jgi:hypothetical protein